jgi:PAS domain S-box-containing protein
MDATTDTEGGQTEIQALVVALIHRLLAADLQSVDSAVDEGLARIGAFAGRDRTYVFVRDGDHFDNTHEWCAPGIAPMIDQLQGLPIADYGALFGPLQENQVILIPDIGDYLPGSPEHELLAAQDIRSLLLVPMLDGADLFGFVGFDSVSARGDFLPGELYLLRAFADVVRSVLLRRATSEDLARERAFLQGIVSTSAAGLLVLDGDGRIVFANEACHDVLGIPVQALLGQLCDGPGWSVTDLDGQPLAEEAKPFRHVLATGENVSNLRIALKVAEETRYISINAAPIPSEAGEPGRVLYAVADVTPIVRAEQARTAALAEAQRASETKSNFLAKMSHELRTPLNGVLGITEILADMTQDPNQRQLISILQDSGQLLLNIINDLLDMTRIEANALQLEEIPFSLAELARRIEEVHTLRASEKHLSFSVMLDDPLDAPRQGDPHRLMQILHNLISNALKFTEHGHVTVQIRAPDPGQVVIEVSDSGIGMTPAEQIAVLEPFSQADASISRRFGGTGLGMSIVKSLTDLFGGQLSIESTPGDGSCISVALPLPLAPGAAPRPVSEPARKAPLPKGFSVLAVDDNRTNLLMLSIMLGRLGAQVTAVSSGQDALTAFEQQPFDLVICDISMPEMDGLTLLQALRDIEEERGAPATPALAFTANAMTHQVAAYLQAGFDGCLTKPLKLEILAATLSEVLAQETGQPFPAFP